MKNYVIRGALTVVLLYFVYKETGPVTVLALALITLGVELQGWLQNKTTTTINLILDSLKRISGITS